MSIRLRRPFFLLLSLIVVLQFRGERVQAAPLQATSISITMSNPSAFRSVRQVANARFNLAACSLPAATQPFPGLKFWWTANCAFT